MRSRYPIGRLLMTWFVVVAAALALSACGGDQGDTPNPTSATASQDGTADDAGLPAASSTTASTTAPTSLPESTATTLSPAETILDSMTLSEKAAQVMLFGFEGTTLLPSTRELLDAGPPGGLLLLGYNVTDADQLRQLTVDLQDAAAATGSAVMLLIAVDQEGGAVQRIRDGVPRLPSARSLGTDHSVTEASRLAAETARALADLGVNMNLAPVADVVDDPGSFLYSRSYGDSADRVSEYVAAVTAAYVENGVIATVKHFPGHGSSSGDTHGDTVLSEAPRTEFEQVHLPPFRAALAAGAECVMAAHIVAAAYDPDRPASLSAVVIGGLLRDELGFTGVVVADDLEMAAASGPDTDSAAGLREATVAALSAGCDLLISTGTLARHKEMQGAVVQAVQTGRLSQDRLDEAVLRVLELKLRHGLVAEP